MRKTSITGLVAAVHSPFHADRSLNLACVEKQAAHLLANDVTIAFICGTTGESHSLTLQERRALAARWMEVARGTRMRIIVHVGSNCLEDSRVLATQAAELGAFAVSAVAPSYFRPPDTASLVECCAEIAAAAPELPFFYYDIPAMTGVRLSVPEFLARARERIPNLAGVKFTNADLMMFQQCLRLDGGSFDVLWGCDEYMLAAWALGATGAVGSTYNFAAPIYHRLIKAFASGDLASAREEQFRSVKIVETLAAYGFMGAAKATMSLLGVDIGPARLPNSNLDSQQHAALKNDLARLGVFDWIKP